MVAILKKWADLSPNSSYDGLSFMVDYCSIPAETYVYGQQRRDMHGELDMDRDGVPHLNDPVEQEALRDGYCYYVDELRKAFPNMKIIANGKMAHNDPDFMASLDGCFFEGAFKYLAQWVKRCRIRALTLQISAPEGSPS
ncbi:MAG: hypothetical protein IPH09_13135 [bacterium]|nr:hypothetical protein [bacterium]